MIKCSFELTHCHNCADCADFVTIWANVTKDGIYLSGMEVMRDEPGFVRIVMRARMDRMIEMLSLVSGEQVVDGGVSEDRWDCAINEPV